MVWTRWVLMATRPLAPAPRTERPQMSEIPFRRKGIVERRREDLHRVDAMTVKVSRVNGRVLIVHPDTITAETSVYIPFPVLFVEMPVFTFGSALETNFWPIAGSYPQLSATVVDWKFVNAVEGVTEGRFIGATVVTVSSGQPDQQIWLNYSFEGKAMRNPINTVGDLGVL